VTDAEMRQIVCRALSNVAPEIDNFVIGRHKEFGVEIPDADVAKLATLNGCVTYLSTTLKQAG